ncbi:MAG: hypothetical protein KY476_08670 [Planctomycetes bacterium]|nr:hypothetical protein [Planctomycetota bacterium]
MKSLSAALAVVVLCAGIHPAGAQEKNVSRVTTALKSANEFYGDLDYVMGLTTAQEQKQTKNLKAYFDMFLIGLDLGQPLRMDLLIDEKPYRYRLAVPVQDLANFRANNLRPLGVENRQIAATLYRLSMEGGWRGYMRMLQQYALLGEFVVDVPAKAPDPRQALAPLIAAYDLGFELENPDPEGNGQAARRKAFNHAEGFRKYSMDLLKQGQDEPDNDFALRKLLFEHQLDEFERLYAEAAHSKAGGIISGKDGKGLVDFTATAIPGTSLDEMIQALAKAPSAFAGIPQSKAPILSVRVNHPLDPMRRENFTETIDLLAKIARDEIAADTTRGDDEKAAANNVVRLVHQLVADTVKAGLADGFAEVSPTADGRHTGVAAMRAADGKLALEAIKLLPAARKGRVVKLDVEKAGDVAIHSVQFSSDDHPGYKYLFGDNMLYVGTSKDTAWLAAGPNAVEAMKTAIGQAADSEKAQPDPRVIQFFAKLRPWVEMRHQRLADKDENPERQKLRRLALEAFEPGDDTLDLEVRRVETGLTGKLQVLPGMLRFIGKVMSDFSKENLDDEKP